MPEIQFIEELLQEAIRQIVDRGHPWPRSLPHSVCPPIACICRRVRKCNDPALSAY